MMFYLFLIISALSGCLATVPRPRGVAISMASFYQPGKTFKCLDGTMEFPYEYLNDDYCDCPDGSDEPGTSACPEGRFHCTNAGYKPQYIPSSRVNDGICDCCDGADEYNGNIECVNNCKELGKKMREEADRLRQLMEEGHKQRQKFSEDGKKSREEKRKQLEELEKKKADLEAVKSDMEAQKADAEAPEKEAKEKHENAWNEYLEQKKAEKEAVVAKFAFEELDQDNNNFVDVAEVMKLQQFDIDSNGEVTEEEAKEHLESEERVDLETFTQKVWPNIKGLYQKSGEGGEEGKGEERPNDPQPPAIDAYDRDRVEERRQEFLRRSKERKQRMVDDEDEDEDDEYDDEDEEDEVDDHGPKIFKQRPKPTPKPELQPPIVEGQITIQGEEEEEDGNSTNIGEEAEKMPDYDDSTKALIAAADEARNKFNEAERQLKDTENEISNLNKYLESDFGPEEEYSVLQGNCYEYTDREYTYKLCAYEKAIQKPKAGGTETSLGQWGKWDGPADDKYSAQKYENGQNCWNGPNRSVRVVFKCGLENKLVNAFEPSRCEYEFDFETPTRCSAPSATMASPDTHDEL